MVDAYPTADSAFCIIGFDGEHTVDFELDNEGTVTGMSYNMSGGWPIPMLKSRTEEEVEKLLSRRVELTTDQLARYTGEYQVLSTKVFTVSILDGALWFKNHLSGLDYEVIPTNDQRLELRASHENYEAVLEDDAVTKLVISIAGVTYEATKL